MPEAEEPGGRAASRVKREDSHRVYSETQENIALRETPHGTEEKKTVAKMPILAKST